MKKQESVLCALKKDTAGYMPLKWVNPELPSQERFPTPKKTTYPLLTGFIAGGKYYTRISQLTAQDVKPGLCRDVHGREVICLKERFPCFDSYDYLYENRYYRWFYIRSGDRLACVYYADQRQNMEVTEDVKKLPERCWKAIEEHKWQIEE